MPSDSFDAFDLPDWVGDGEVTWTATASVHAGHRVPGELSGSGESMPCDLLAVDQAYPAPVVDDALRRAAHRAWTHGQVLLTESDGRLVLAVPGTGFTADRALETIGRFAKAVGVAPGRFLVAVRL